MSNTSKPSLRFFHSEELRLRTIEVLNKLEYSEDPKQYRNALGELIVELTNTGMDYFLSNRLS